MVLGAALCLVVWWRYRGEDLSHVRRASAGEIGRTLLIAFPAIALPFVIRAAVVEGVATATEVSTIGIVYSILAGLLIYRQFDWGRLMPMLTETAALSGAILLIIGAATGMAWALTQSGFSSMLATAMTWVARRHRVLPGGLDRRLHHPGQRAGGHPRDRAVRAAAVPIARQIGVHEVHYAMVVVLAMGIGLFAPPFGVGYYAACAISRIHPDEGMKPIVGYMLALIAGLIVVAAVPDLDRLPGLGGISAGLVLKAGCRVQPVRCRPCLAKAPYHEERVIYHHRAWLWHGGRPGAPRCAKWRT